KLALGTTLVLSAVGLPLAWWLATTRRRAKVLVEAAVALPLVLPPTVLGFYLLTATAPYSLIRPTYETLTGRPPPFPIPRAFRGVSALQSALRGPSVRRGVRGRGPAVDRSVVVSRRVAAANVLPHRRAAIVAGHPGGDCAHVRTHGRRVRRRADGRRQYPGR